MVVSSSVSEKLVSKGPRPVVFLDPYLPKPLLPFAVGRYVANKLCGGRSIT
jgi:hypothetical protein